MYTNSIDESKATDLKTSKVPVMRFSQIVNLANSVKRGKSLKESQQNTRHFFHQIHGGIVNTEFIFDLD